MSWYWITIALIDVTERLDKVGIGLIGREYIEIQRVTMRCLQAGIICSFSPEPFTRFAIYGLIGLVEACALFGLSVVVEERVRRRSFAPEWR